MGNYDNERTVTVLTILLLSGLGIAILAFVLWGIAQFGVYNRTPAGRAALTEAESTCQVRVLEVEAEEEAAWPEAKAEIIKAQGPRQRKSNRRTEVRTWQRRSLSALPLRLRTARTWRLVGRKNRYLHPGASHFRRNSQMARRPLR